eukprot:4668551-Prymnesium_polylepis.1
MYGPAWAANAQLQLVAADKAAAEFEFLKLLNDAEQTVMQGLTNIFRSRAITSPTLARQIPPSSSALTPSLNFRKFRGNLHGRESKENAGK